MRSVESQASKRVPRTLSGAGGPIGPAERIGDVETMTIEVLAPDVREIWTLEATSNTAYADGTLDVALSDGTVRHFDLGEWMDVRLAETWTPPTGPAA